MMKRLLSLLVCLSMLVSLMPVNAVFAEDTLQAEERAVVTLDTPTGLYTSEWDVVFNGVALYWNDVSGATGYEVQYRPVNVSAWTTYGSVSVAYANLTGLTCGQEYYFRVRAVADDGTTVSYSQYSSMVRNTPRPAAPYFGAYQKTVSSIQLEWSAVTGAQGYNIYRSENGGEFTLLKTFSGYTVYDYVDSGLTVGNTYVYEIAGYRVMNGVTVEGVRAMSDEIKILPLAPTGVKAAVATASSVKITWNAVSGASSYNVYRANSSGGAYSAVATGVTGVTYTDTGLLTGATYYYYVTTVVNGAESDPSDTVSATPVLLPPADFAVASTTSSTVKLTWDNVPLASGYRLYYSTEGLNSSKDALLNATCIDLSDSDLTYTFTGLDPSTKYYFQIFAYVTINVSGSTTSDMVSNGSMVITAYTNPTTPTGLTATVADYNVVDLAWNDIGEDVDGYEIYRSTDKTNYTLIATIGNEYAYTSTGVCGTSYAYKIRAYKIVDNTKIYSAYSAVVTAKPVPNAPDYVAAEGLDGTSIKVDWHTVNGATGYYVYGRVKGENDFSLMADVDGGSTVTTTLTNMTPGLEMEFRVCAYRTVSGKKVAGKFSYIVSAMAMPLAPTDVTTSLVDEHTLTVSWKASKGASGYDVYMWYEAKVYEEPTAGTMSINRSGVGLEEMTFLVSTAETSYTVSGLVPGYVYYFRVVPFVDGNGETVTGPESDLSAGNFPRPKKPQSFTGKSLSTTEAQLDWSATAFVSTNLRGYEISYSVDGAQTWNALIDVNDPATLTYVHEGRDDDTTYMYRIRSYVYSDGVKVYSVYSTVITVAPKPTQATNLKATSNDVNTITLTFNGELEYTRYQVFRSTSKDSGFAKIGVVLEQTDPAGFVYDDTTAKIGTTYYYRLRPLHIGADGTLYYGDYSATVAATSRPAVPENVTATPSGTTTAWVRWDKVAGVTGYQVYRSKSENSGFTLVKSLSSSYTSFNDTGLVTGQTYFYKVRGYVTVNGTNVYGGFCDPVKMVCEPVSPANFTVASTTYNSATLTWKAMEGAASFTITAEYIDHDGEAQKKTKEVDGKLTSATMSGFPVGVEVTFSIVTNVTLGDSVVTSDPASTATSKICPAKVTGLTATSASTLSNTLKWNAVDGALYYIVKRSYTGETGTFEAIPAATQVKATTYVDTDAMAAGTLVYYRVVAVSAMPDGTPVEGLPSNKVKVVSTPATPAELTVKSGWFNCLKLTWKAVESADGYQIYRSTKKDSGFALIATVTANSYNDTPLTCGATYYYKVRAYVEAGDKYFSAYTGVVSGKPVPQVPADVTVVAAATTSAKVTWKAVTGASGYQVAYKDSTATAWTNIGTTTKLTLTKTDLTVGRTYQFRVRAYRTVNGTNVYGGWSTAAELVQMPPVPQELKTTNVNSNSIKATWKACTGVSGYEVHISTSETGTYTLKATVTTNSATLTGLEIGVRVYVKVRAYGLNGKGEKVYGDFSDVAYRMPRPVAPTLKIASYNASSVTLKWNAIADATGYVIYSKANASDEFVELTRVVGSNITSYRDDSVVAGGYYYYMVQAMSQTTDPGLYVFSVDSNVVYQKITLSAPAITLKAPDMTTITVSWSDVGAQKYFVRRATAKNGEYYLIGEVSGSTFSFTDADRKPGKTYYYKVIAGSNGANGWAYTASSVASIATKPGKPQNVKVSRLTYNGAKVTWSEVAGATGYEVHVRIGSKTATRKLMKTVGAQTSANIYGLTCGKTCYFEVRALYNDVKGAFSAQASLKMQPTMPSGLKASALGEKKVKLSWEKVAGATGYIVYRATSENGTYTQVGTTTKLTITLTKQNAGVKYYYKVAAYRTVDGTKVVGSKSAAKVCTPEP